MANKVKELGTVKVVHGSGVVETDTGERSMVKAQVGDRLVQCIKTNKVSVAPKKTDGAGAIDPETYENLGVDELKEKFSLKQLKAIAKAEGMQGYSKLKEDEVANLIVHGTTEPQDKGDETSNDDADGTDEEDTTGSDDVSGDE